MPAARSCACRSASTARRSSASPPHAWSRYASRSAAEALPSASAKMVSSLLTGTTCSAASRARAIFVRRRRRHRGGHLPIQPRPRVRPVPVGGRDGNAQRLRRLFVRQAAEVAEVDELRLLRVLLGELDERFVERDQLVRRVVDGDVYLVEI